MYVQGEKNIKYLSELERYELININDGEKYDYLQNNDLVIDDKGNIKYLLIDASASKMSFFGNSREILEIDWECVKKVGAKTIILDADERNIRRAKV
ncbi:MAG: YlmC/YmxH family sporulation protein [Clostridium sp.]|uniref:YlmC/YmxH family sporulation protein n=1 Tax=Clostridium TaxID=1485 RepID=UPI001883B2C8|nr:MULTISPECIES: YlmC/YmxH family sporulation protein [Clostridium]MCR6515255.1 YlmC/YmxH family sporulation protein [Clostridium sp. LY3-2]